MQGIYKIVNEVNGKYYVGSSIDIDLRWKQHLQSLRKNSHKNDKLQHAWNFYGESIFKFLVVERLEDQTEDQLRKREDHYLIICKKEPDTNYNCCYDSRGGSLSAYTIDKIRKKCSAVPRTKIWRERISEANKRRYNNGFQFSFDAKSRMAFRGPHSIETRNKIKSSLTGTHRPTKNSDLTIRTFINRKTSELVSMSTYEFRVKYNLDRTMFCRLLHGKAKRCGDWSLQDERSIPRS